MYLWFENYNNINISRAVIKCCEESSIKLHNMELWYSSKGKEFSKESNTYIRSKEWKVIMRRGIERGMRSMF
jgi:hypothetical protein